MPTGTLSLEEIKQRAQWRMLTDAQQRFVEAYINSDGDRRLAIKAAYNVKDKYALAYCCRILSLDKIKAVLKLYFGTAQHVLINTRRVNRSEMVGMISHHLRNSELSAHTFLHLSCLYAALCNWRAPRKLDNRSVSELVKQMEQKRQQPV